MFICLLANVYKFSPKSKNTNCSHCQGDNVHFLVKTQVFQNKFKIKLKQKNESNINATLKTF